MLWHAARSRAAIHVAVIHVVRTWVSSGPALHELLGYISVLAEKIPALQRKARVRKGSASATREQVCLGHVRAATAYRIAKGSRAFGTGPPCA
jgi:hypothetical protein